MKKLLVLFVVLGLCSASVASASPVLQLSVNGQVAPAEIVMMPSDVITLDIHLMDGVATKAYDVTMTKEGLASLDIAPMTFPTDFDFAGKLISSDENSVRVGASQFFSPEVVGPAILVDGILLHCHGEGLVLVELTVADAAGMNMPGMGFETGQVLDSLIIRQIPEPLTLSLLGLGGLGLLRRRRA